MIFQIKSYLKFLWNSKNEHGVHSPFVFHLVTKCFYDSEKHPEYAFLKSYRNALLNNAAFIEVTDFGAGSKVFTSNKRQISKIAKTAGITQKRSELLFRVVKHFQPSTVLEIGTSLGLATSALSIGNPNAKIITLEGCPETAKTAQKEFEKSGLKKIKSVVGEFSESLSDVRLSALVSPGSATPRVDMVFFDGNHQKDATLEYFNLLLPTITNDSVWIFDDIHWSAEMGQAWEIIKQNPKVTVTIDTFQWGFVFFRKEQEKEHFIIRP